MQPLKNKTSSDSNKKKYFFELPSNSIIYYPLNMLIVFFEKLGDYSDLMSKIFRSRKSWKYYLPLTVSHMFNIGVKSVPIVILTGMFAGMVLAVQASYQIDGSIIPGFEYTMGGVIGKSVLLELAPMITALIMTGKIGATIAAEIGTMRVSEQIDALESLSYDPIAYLIFPRILASMIVFPLLIAVADLFGLLGAIIVTTDSLGMSVDDFMKGLTLEFEPLDYWFGIIKGFFFGLAITSIACFYGFNTKGGAEGVGKTTTATVVVSCVTIVFIDYILGEIILL
tara:strand:- start:342 stop:1190 length:849 start_codon:yes stop_codon:yes gene_type:complete